MSEEAQRQVQGIEFKLEEKRDNLLSEGRRNFEALEAEIIRSVSTPAEREKAASSMKQMGEAVERTLALCKERLKNFAGSKDFAPVLDTFMAETIECARRLLRSTDTGAPLGELIVSPDDLQQCRNFVKKHNINVTVCAEETLWGGVELVMPENSHRIRNTLAVRMEKNESQLRSIATAKIREALSREGPS